MTKRVPQRRNGNAGKFTGSSESAKYFASHPEARKKKNEYNTKYHASEERKDYRVGLNKKTRENPTGSEYDNSHTKDGKIVRERRSTNRARNGKNGKSSKK